MTRTTIILLVVAALSTGCASTPETIDLFDGATLDGWHALPGGTWTVEDGVIVGRSPVEERNHGLLVTDATFSDFVATFEYKLVTGDSGFYFRIEENDSHVGCFGYQVEVDDVEPGGLYETGGRAWVVKHTHEAAAQWHRSGDWNRVELRAVGPDIEVTVNGIPATRLHDPQCRREGHFALQLHGGQDMHVAYRNVHVTPIE